MSIPLTYATLTLMTVAMVLLGAFWSHVPPRLRFFLPRAAIVLILLHGFFVVAKWGTTWDRLNVVINWLAVAGYELLLVLFSRLSPRWLTSLSAAILIVPLFASSVVMPLALIFRSGSLEKFSIDHNLYYIKNFWEENATGTPGVDLEIYYRPSFAPFLSRKLQTQPFNSAQCRASAATIQSGPNPGTVLARCPHLPSQAPGSDDKVIQLH
ncbi:MAG: hypothetical protein WDN23_11990 [Edaphobacter sp.]